MTLSIKRSTKPENAEEYIDESGNLFSKYTFESSSKIITQPQKAPPEKSGQNLRRAG